MSKKNTTPYAMNICSGVQSNTFPDAKTISMHIMEICKR